MHPGNKLAVEQIAASQVKAAERRATAALQREEARRAREIRAAARLASARLTKEAARGRRARRAA